MAKKKIEPKTNRGRIPEKVLQGIIEDLKGGMNENLVAEKHNRPLEQILKVFETHIKPYLSTSLSGSSKVDLVQKLKSRPEWTQFNEEFSKEEMEMFLYEYCKLMADFGDDTIRSSEENQLFMSIRYWILMHRNMKDRKKTTIDKEETEKELEKIIKLGPSNPMFKGDDDKYYQYREMLQNRITILESAQNSKTVEHKTLTERHQKFMEDLKATRNQRIEKFAQNRNKLNFVEIIKELEEEENRKRIGTQIELVKRSAEKQEHEWGKIFRYADNELDRRVLDSDTVNIEEFAEQKTQMEILNGNLQEERVEVGSDGLGRLEEEDS